MIFFEESQIPACNRQTKLATEIVANLSALPYVRAIALFGSLAEGRADSWSDVDMLVACDDVQAAKWSVAAAMYPLRPVLFYRPFSSATQPSGRYWFEGESPFHKLDISFDSDHDYAAKAVNGELLGHRIVSRDLYRRASPNFAVREYAQARPLTIHDAEMEIGSLIYQSLRSLKRSYRGEPDRKGFDSLLAAAADLPHDAVMNGGRIGRLVHAVADEIAKLDEQGTLL